MATGSAPRWRSVSMGRLREFVSDVVHHHVPRMLVLARLPQRRYRSASVRLGAVEGRLRYAVSVPDADALTARQLNLDVILDTLLSHGIEHFLVDDRWSSPPVLGVPASERRRLADALARVTEVPLYAKVKEGDGSTRRSFRPTVAHGGRDLGQTFWTFAYVVDPNSTARLGHAEGCLIEFWEDVDAALRPLTSERRSRIDAITPDSRRHPETLNVRGREVSSYSPLPVPGMFDVGFPVDAVYMWVDGDDPRWQVSRRRRLIEAGGDVPEDATHAGRFRQFDELRYSLRSLERHAPWIRNIFLVTDRQRPDWLNEAGTNLTVLDHRDFMPAAALPTFNSHAIEAALHRIPGLADHFLVMNDDVFLGSPVDPETLFLSNGVAKFFVSKTPITRDPRTTIEFARLHSANLVESVTGVRPEQLMKHTPMAFVRPFLEELEGELRDAWHRTVYSPFRSKSDLVPALMHHYIGYTRRITRPAPIKYDYFAFGTEAGERGMRKYRRSRPVEFFCVNDEARTDEVVRAGRDFLSEFLVGQFPIASRFERSTAGR